MIEIREVKTKKEIKQFIEFQKEYDSFLFVPDMHTITVPQKNSDEIMKDYYIGYTKTQNEVAQKMFDKVIETLNNCKNYYMFDREEDNFRCAIALGASPTSNPKTVKEWWKENEERLNGILSKGCI